MKKQFTKIKIAAENLSRSNKTDRKDFELDTIEKQVEKYRDVLEKMVRKMPAATTTTDPAERDKRIKKNSHYKIGQALEESAKELPKDMPLHKVLTNCGELEKSIAECTVESELKTETEVVSRLKHILDNEIQEISTLKRNVSRTVAEYASLKRSYEAAIRLDEPQSKINHIKDQQEQCEVKLEKDRDSWAAQMFELIAKEDVIVQCIRDYVLNQRNYHERALHKVNSSLANIQDVIQRTVKSRFGTSLSEHLASTKREISYILELCICCLVEYGLYEEGLLRVGCASTKLRRMKHALEAQYVKTPLPLDYQDPHVIGSILKLYLRELPEPLLTYRYYKDFIRAADRATEAERRADVKATLQQLPKENYANLRYLTKFLWLVTQNVDHNKMTSQNLAIVMSPNMLWPRVDKSSPADYLGEVNSSSAVNIIVELLISQWDYFFEGDVDFFVTLQRSSLYVEGKSKSNSSNENLDRHDAETLDSPRYGTIRRQKAYAAPSPPGKAAQGATITAVSYTPLNPEAAVVDGRPQRNGVRELFAGGGGSGSAVSASKSNNNSSSNNHTASADKPEKPPLPKQLQLQQQQDQQPPMAPPQTPKPVPMTRTQFFGLDTLTSPTVDRKSNDSVGSLGSFKPDLPQKPKIPKRPMMLSLSGTGGGRSDEETTPTPPEAGGGVGASLKSDTEKFIETLRNETNCDNILAATTTKISGPISNENNHYQQSVLSEQNTNTNSNLNSNLNASSCAPATSSATPADALSGDKTFATPAAPTNQTQDSARPLSINTPTTPVSPNMIQTPKRPTVPAPPPPSVVKKQVE